MALDQISKYFVRTYIPLNSSITIIPNILSLTYVQNTGVSFGLFKGMNILFIIISFIAIFLFLHLMKKHKKYYLYYSIVLGGIFGNLIDRVFLGYVVDFIDIWIWPVFNIADACISIGIILLIIKSSKDKVDLF